MLKRVKWIFVQYNIYLVPLTPLSNGLKLVPMVINTDDSTTSQSFGWRGNLQVHPSDNNSITSVMIKIRKHQPPLYDANDNNILWILRQTLIDYMILVGWTHCIQTNKNYVSVIWYTVVTTRAYFNEHFRHPTLSKEAMR